MEVAFTGIAHVGSGSAVGAESGGVDAGLALEFFSTAGIGMEVGVIGQGTKGIG